MVDKLLKTQKWGLRKIPFEMVIDAIKITSTRLKTEKDKPSLQKIWNYISTGNTSEYPCLDSFRRDS